MHLAKAALPIRLPGVCYNRFYFVYTCNKLRRVINARNLTTARTDIQQNCFNIRITNRSYQRSTNIIIAGLAVKLRNQQTRPPATL